MQVKSAIGLAVGPVSARRWGQVLVLPHAYGIVEVEDSGGDAQAIGVRALSQLGAQLSDGAMSLQKLEEIASDVFSSEVRTVILFAPVGTVVYVVMRGTGAVILKRGGKLATLVERAGSISGEAQLGDMFLLASCGFVTHCTPEELVAVFDHLPPGEVAEKLTMLLHEKTGGEGSVSLVYQVAALEDLDAEPNALEELEDNAKNRTPVDKPVFLSRQHLRDHTKKVLLRLPHGGKLTYFIGQIRRNPRKRTAFIAIALSLLFLTSVVLGVVKQAANKQRARVASAVADAQQAMEEGVALLDLNPVKGRERLAAAKTILEPLRASVSARSGDGVKIDSLYRQITDNLTQSMHENDVSLQLFYDLALLRAGGKADAMALDGDSLSLVDRAAGAVYLLTVSSKNAQIVGGSDRYKGASLVGVHGDRVYTLVDGGIHQYSAGDKKTIPLVIKKDEAWGYISSMVSFAGNVYLLDTRKGRIWKYVATETGFSELREYLNPDILPDLSGANSMAIDGSVWLGTTGGAIMRFTQGRDNSYTPQGVNPPLGQNVVVFTSDAVNNVYVLDVRGRRVVVLDKDGLYLAQYRWSDSLTATSLVVSESLGKILLLAGGKLYSIDLK